VLTTTYGSYTIGSHEKTAIGSLTNLIPTLGALTYYDGNSAVTNVTGNNQMIIQNKSSLVITIPTYSLKKKATVRSFKLSYNGKSYDVSAGSNVTIGTVDKTGSMTASLVLTDSRGQSVTVTKAIVYTAYSLPQISWEYYRSNSGGKKDLLSGTYIYIKPSYTIANIAGNNVSSSTIKIGTETVSSNAVNGVGVTYGNSYAISKSYNLTMTVQDKLLGSTTISGTIAVAELPMNITKDKTGIALGTVASNGQITLGKPTVVSGMIESKNYFVAANNQGLRVKDTGGTPREIISMNSSNQTVLPNNNVYINQNLFVGGIDYRLKMFPVNSIYLTYNNVNPSTFLGGTWSLVGQNRYIIGAGSSYSGGATGGSSTSGSTALTISQIPPHRHSFDVELTWPGGSSNIVPYHNGTTSQGSIDTTSVGGGQGHTHSISPLYIAIYIWRRTG
ncbi:phage baseplate protein, partial [Beduini massiliensis]